MKKIATPYKKGDRFTTAYKVDLKIMAIVDNYAMYRYMKTPPRCMHVVEFRKFLFKIGAKKIEDKVIKKAA